MGGKNATLQMRLYLIGACILLAGLVSAALVYVTATDHRGDAVSYEMVDGNVYAISPDDSKRYLRDVERYGGKAAVLTDEFSRWFSDLWQGRQLAYTLASVAVVVALACFLAGYYLSHQLSHSRTEDQ